MRLRGHTGWVHVVPLDGSEPPAANVGTGHGRGSIAVGFGSVWVAHGYGRTVACFDPRTLRVTAMQTLSRSPVAIATGASAVWIVAANGWLWRIFPAGPQAEGVTRLGRRPRALAALGSSIWALREAGHLLRLDASTGEVTLETDIGGGTRNLLAAAGTLWATAGRGRRLLQVEPDSGRIAAEIPLPARATRLAGDENGLWVACSRAFGRSGALHRVDAVAGTVDAAIELPARPRALCVGADGVWVACGNRYGGTIERIDPANGAMRPLAETEWPVNDLAIAGDRLFATMSIRLGGPIFDGDGMIGAGEGGSGGEGGGG